MRIQKASLLLSILLSLTIGHTVSAQSSPIPNGCDKIEWLEDQLLFTRNFMDKNKKLWDDSVLYCDDLISRAANDPNGYGTIYINRDRPVCEQAMVDYNYNWTAARNAWAIFFTEHRELVGACN